MPVIQPDPYYISGYKECFPKLKKTCANKFEIGKKNFKKTEIAGLDGLDSCKKYCNEDKKCKFIYYVPKEGHCLRYEACEENRKPWNEGSTYAKESNCPDNIMKFDTGL